MAKTKGMMMQDKERETRVNQGLASGRMVPSGRFKGNKRSEISGSGSSIVNNR